MVSEQDQQEFFLSRRSRYHNERTLVARRKFYRTARITAQKYSLLSMGRILRRLHRTQTDSRLHSRYTVTSVGDS